MEQWHFSVSDQSGNLYWENKEGWKVSDYFIDDIDHDGEDEVVILFWRRGSFGPSKPFWVEKDEKTWSQHIGIEMQDDGTYNYKKVGVPPQEDWNRTYKFRRDEQ